MRHVSEELRRRQRAEAITTVIELILKVTLPLAVVVLSFAVLQLAHIAQTREDGTLCRARVNSEVAGLSDEVTAKTSEIFVAAIREDDAKVARLGADLEKLTERLYPAIERRDRAVESCRR